VRNPPDPKSAGSFVPQVTDGRLQLVARVDPEIPPINADMRVAGRVWRLGNVGRGRRVVVARPATPLSRRRGRS
jgi:hypothetical protein